MKRKELDAAVEQARIFIKRAEALTVAAVAQAIPATAPNYSMNFPKESGALRRTSMELTRALAELRKS